jgi:hypothetical protein
MLRNFDAPLFMQFLFPLPLAMLILSGVGLCVAMFLCSLLGYRLGLSRGNGIDGQFGIIETATLGLVALMLAFTFQIALSRFEEGRQLIVEEANAIGTAYLRIDVLDPSDQPGVRNLFRTYVDARLHAFATVAAGGNPDRDIAQTRQLQDRLWHTAVAAAKRGSTPGAPILLLPAMNAMIDVTTSRLVNYRTHIPVLIKGLLFALAIIGSLVIGYAMGAGKGSSLVPAVIFAVVVSAVIYTILDLDSPRYGLIRLDAAQEALGDARSSLH